MIILGNKKPEGEFVLEIGTVGPHVGFPITARQFAGGNFNTDGSKFTLLISQDFQHVILQIEGETQRRILPLGQIIGQWLDKVGGKRDAPHNQNS